MKVVIFCAFGLKTPIHAHKIGVFGDLTHLVGSDINWLIFTVHGKQFLLVLPTQLSSDDLR